MVDRFLAIEPPVFRVLSKFDAIIEEIERAYVLGAFFSALAAAVVTIERVLNDWRMRLHQWVTPKIKDLWNKGPLNEWEGNIAALETWTYLPPTLAGELRQLFDLRCQYLHSAPIADLQGDAVRAVRGAYDLLRELLGFPERLFEIGPGAGIRCLNEPTPWSGCTTNLSAGKMKWRVPTSPKHEQAPLDRPRTVPTVNHWVRVFPDRRPHRIHCHATSF